MMSTWARVGSGISAQVFLILYYLHNIYETKVHLPSALEKGHSA